MPRLHDGHCPWHTDSVAYAHGRLAHRKLAEGIPRQLYLDAIDQTIDTTYQKGHVTREIGASADGRLWRRRGTADRTQT